MIFLIQYDYSDICCVLDSIVWCGSSSWLFNNCNFTSEIKASCQIKKKVSSWKLQSCFVPLVLNFGRSTPAGHLFGQISESQVSVLLHWKQTRALKIFASILTIAFLENFAKILFQFKTQLEPWSNEAGQDEGLMQLIHPSMIVVQQLLEVQTKVEGFKSRRVLFAFVSKFPSKLLQVFPIRFLKEV